MTSSMLAGERRWASARRGGMTVLGKVAVPKPINLPSQKLENHGLDPNVEIVPKGSLSWGSRPSSSTSNPWGSSAVSPNADGTNVSPHHPSGRPSSGGSLNRPSTAGSDIHDPSATTWGPNSRPSSASGVLTSNQSSLTSSRPFSAETRPGSSHLSCFAEPAFDNSMAWGPNGTADKMSMPSKVNDFSLSSGDFPTLGSEKDNTAKSSETHDHGSHVRPGSCSGRTAPPMDRNEMVHADHKSGTVDTWTRDSSPQFEDGVCPGVGMWQGDPQQHMSPNVPPQHFDAWRGPPMNAPPAGVWYRGPPPAGPPYPPVPHGGYPMEPFPYYHPQFPPNLANPQLGPPPGRGPRGHHPRNGDFYRPQMPDTFIRPGMPIRPGFYPGPVPYDGYYGPPMGYNPNDRDIPFMGMPPGSHGSHGPPVYNMGPPQNPSEVNEAHFRGSGHGSGGNMRVSEQLDSIPPEESRGPYKVLRKPNHERHVDLEEDNWEQNLDKSDQPRPSFHKNEWGVDTRRNEDTPSRRNLGNQGHPSDSVIAHSHESPHTSKPSNESLGNKSSFPEVHQDIPANSKDPSFIQKIEGLNAKVRASDGSGAVREEQKNRLLINPNLKENSTTIAFGTISDIGDLNTSKSITASASLFSSQTHHGVRSQQDHHSKGRLNNQDTGGWQKKPPVLGSDVAASVSAENSETKNTGESLTAMTDPADGQAQRARMRELAKQRAIQLQKEEEERIREQKAKALAKLEELNRRTLAAADGTIQTAEKTVITVHAQEDVDGFQKPSEPAIDDNKHEEPAAEISENSQQKPVDQSLVSKQSVANATDAEIKAAPLGSDGNLHKQKRAGHRQKQGVQMVESSVDKSTLNAVIKNSGTNVTVPGEDVPSQQSSHLNISNILFESTQQGKRNNKSGKNKHKLDDASASKEGDLAKPVSPQFDSNSSNVLVTDGKDAMQSNLEQISSLPSNQFKPQHPRRMPRNPQANRAADRFRVGDVAVWAPVRAQNKEEHVDEYSQRTQQDDVALPAKTINSGQTNLKNKRAEMERYVPKPVAKELAQQGTGNQSASSSSPEKTALEDMTDREDLGSQLAIPVSVSMRSTVESKVGDNKQNKQEKSHGAWKQRGPTDLNRDQGFQQDSKKDYQKSTSHQHEPANPVPADLNRDQGFQQDTKRSYQNIVSQHEPANPVPIQQDSKKTYQKSMNRHEPVNPVPTETTVMHEWDPSDGWFMPDEVLPVTSVVKDEGGATGKGKKPAYKGQRNTVKNHNVNHMDISGAEVEIDQTERPVSPKENRSSQWQPKTQSYKGGWSGGGQNANSAVKPEEPIAEYKNVRRAPHERKPASFRGQADSSNQGFGSMEDEGSGFRKYGGQNNRPGGQDNRRQHNQHNANVHRERHRQNLHYEYQPVGSNNNNINKSSNGDAPAADGSGNAGPRYKERDSGQSRRGGGGGSVSGGHFYGRQ